MVAPSTETFSSKLFRWKFNCILVVDTIMCLNRFLCKLKPLFTFYFSRPQWNLISQGKSECKFNEHYLILKLICRQYFVKFKTSFMWTHLITSLLSYVDHQLVKKCSDEKFRLSVSFKMHHIFFSSLFSFH